MAERIPAFGFDLGIRRAASPEPPLREARKKERCVDECASTESDEHDVMPSWVDGAPAADPNPQENGANSYEREEPDSERYGAS